MPRWTQGPTKTGSSSWRVKQQHRFDCRTTTPSTTTATTTPTWTWTWSCPGDENSVLKISSNNLSEVRLPVIAWPGRCVGHLKTPTNRIRSISFRTNWWPWLPDLQFRTFSDKMFCPIRTFFRWSVKGPKSAQIFIVPYCLTRFELGKKYQWQ